MRAPIILLISLFFLSTVNAKPLTFPGACTQGNSILIAAVGDILLHEPLQNKATRQGFMSLWSAALPFIQSADIAYANLEGPMAFNINRSGKEVSTKDARWYEKIYTGFPQFNYHPNLAGALKNSGFDVISTANNHALDRFSIGIDKTILAFNQTGLAYMGTKLNGSNQTWIKMIQKNGINIAWIACTEMTNGLMDHHQQVLYCYKKKDRQWILNKIEELKSQVDAIIITPHWGEEYQHKPNRAQIAFAHQVLDAGATAVIGSHPHVLQPLQTYLTKDGRTTLIMYSLGNFVSYQGKPQTQSTIILLFGLTKTNHGTIINGVRFVPMYMQNRNGIDNLQLNIVNHANSSHAQIISNILPMENAIYSPIKKTNLECQ